MADVDDFFSGFRSDTVNPLRVAAFEEACVKKLLTKFGVKLNLAAWKRAIREEYGHTALTLPWFMQYWPQFPMQLVVSKYQYPGKLPYAALLGGKLSKLTVLNDYTQLAAHYEAHPERERFGMLFKCQRAKYATLQVLHNQPTQSTVVDFDAVSDTYEGTHCRRFMFWYKRVHYVIEGIDSFVGTVGTDWVTDGGQW
jgi:hypothetical protein